MDGPRQDVLASGTVTDLFISEYIEGSSNNKAIEIYNGTSAPIDLTAGQYVVQMYFNGAATAGTTVTLTGSIPANGTFVLAQSAAVQAIRDKANQQSSASFYNGDDAIVLRKGGVSGTIVDVIGQIGFDPGTQWGTDLASTADNTIRRKSSICQGDVNGSDAFDPATEWDGYANDTFDGLGAHTAACGAVATPPTVATVIPAAGATEVPVNSNLTITFSNPVTVTGAWYTISCSVSGARTATVTGGPSAFTLNPDSNLSPEESCTVTVNAANVATSGVPMATDFSWSFTTAGAASCDAAFTPAYTIQGTGPASPLVNSTVTTKGVVVADLEGPPPTLRGFYLQDMTGDGDPATSDAVFVFNGSNDNVNVGDVVRVTGSVSEFSQQTQISATDVLLCGTGAVTPFDLELPFAAGFDFERLEGMLVRLPQTLTVTETFSLGRFGEVVLSSGGRLPQPTNIAAPGAAALAVQAQNDRNRIVLDDEVNTQNRDPVVFGRGGNPLTASNTLRGGDEVTNVTGILSGAAAGGLSYRVRPIGALGGGLPMFVARNPRPTTVSVSGSTRVAFMNVLNYFNTFTGCTAGVSGVNADCRGANNTDEFTRQRAKIIAAIQALGSDVVGLSEMENDGYGNASAIRDLVDGLNAAGSGPWAFIDADAATGQTNTLGLDAIKVALVYRTDRVTPVGRTAVLNSTAFINGGDAFPYNRPALAQAFERPDRARVVVVVNHLKSKGSACSTPDAGDGQGNCNSVRVNAANRLREWLATDPTEIGESRTLIMGDLNAYAKEDPITALVNGGYVNLADTFLGQGSYTYVFQGQWGSLDHALASPSLQGQVAGLVKHHINADEPTALDYDTDFKTANADIVLYAPDQYRSADHDPIVVGLNLTPPPVAPYTWGGFLTPTQTLPTLTNASAGLNANVRFRLGGNMGLGILKAGSPVSRTVNCTTLAPLGTFEPTAAATSLTYVASTASYSYFWRTNRAWSGSCRELVLRFIDGSQQRAVYRFL